MEEQGSQSSFSEPDSENVQVRNPKWRTPVEFLQQQFLRWLGPTILCGATTRTWLELLRQNGFRVSPRYFGRAAIITGLTLQNSIMKRIEDWALPTDGNANVHPPIFVLGCWRSGTTHLHNLLARDARYAFPNSFQVMNPYVFLLNERWNAPIQNLFYPAKRAMDDVHFSAIEPQEDEFAIAAMSGLSPMIAFSFWNNRQRYNAFTTLKTASESELKLWQESLGKFVRKLSLKYDRPLVLKSPAHTAKIQLLLEMHPKAKFVMIHRHPYEVAVSGQHMYEKNLPLMALQTFDTSELGDEIVEHFGGLFDAYFEQKELIPDGNLIEIPFADLDQDPMGTLASIYDQLGLADFEVTRPQIQAYVDSLSGYSKNAHKQLDPRLKTLVADRWARCFSEWGYAS